MADILADTGAVDNKRRKLADSVAGLPADVVSHFRDETLHWSATSGVLIGADSTFAHAPCALLPYPFPSSLFDQAKSLAAPFNVLVDRCARSTDWLHKTTRSVVGHDPFTSRLLTLSETVTSEGVAQQLQLGIYRSDYMVHQPSEDAAPRLLQVELNTISASFAALSCKMSTLHRSLLERWGAVPGSPESEALKRIPALAAALGDSDVLPTNGSEPEICAAIAAAHAEYVKLAGGDERVSPVVLMIVQPTERNVIDQRGIELTLWANHKIPVVRISLDEIVTRAVLCGPQRRLRLSCGTGSLEASVIYFRAGYTPNDYPSQVEWDGRLLLERSFGIKCPSIGQHLAGTKKVQQVVADPEELARFVAPEHAARLRSCFAGLYGFDEDDLSRAQQVVDMACAAPERYVLKPQREGGGNNLFDEELKEALQKMTPAERASYILMERIVAPTHPALLMKGTQVEGGPSICELGIYGVFLGDGRRVLLNQAAGHLLRVKMANVNEGGVVAGFAGLGSPVLFP